MKSIARLRPSPALAISLIALFVSLGGVSYGVASGAIGSREIKNNSVRSRDLRNNEIRTFDIRNGEVRGVDIRNSTIQGRDIALNTVTGLDIRESTLGQVPSAATLGGVGVHKFSYLGQAGTGFVPVLNVGGLALQAECLAGPQLVVRGNPAAALANSELLSSTFSANDTDFDPGDNATVIAAGDSSGAGDIAFMGSSGSVVVVHALALEDTDDVRGTTNDCGFVGFAESG